ncbi:hypothetical protein J2W35_006924 [Variovorax boronicumulans]|uniref:hypothetical protein n=1 Tax=Variovorax boronicumulans TaxID=436515 RepID=UPI00278AD070|nr:hypothetical protein [Variovorax boronicumulans]MDQ0086541.1 hypothetical protein [Variovorax boronicumulans]
MTCIMVATTSVLTIHLLNRVEAPTSLEASMPEGGRQQVDIVLVDQPDVDDDYVCDVVKPMLMVFALRLPGKAIHLRLIINREGFPVGYAADRIGIAGYAKENDTFVVDAHLVATRQGPPMDAPSWRAFLMAHEAFHKVQHLRGDLVGHSSTAEDREAYAHDIHEWEAFREGTLVANALLPAGRQFAYEPKLLPLITAPTMNPYAELAVLKVADVADVRIHRTWTPLGIYRRWRAGHSS